MTADTFRVLLVEDDLDDVELTREALKVAKFSLDLRVVNDGEAALRFLRRQKEFTGAPTPDMIFLDLNLPGLDGRGVLQQIKEDDALKHIPVIVLSTSGAEEDILKSYKLHANAYVRKPIGLDTFVDVVHAIEQFWLTIAKLPPNKS
jgi:chemotaxis family two-component system response regulator Rcp1